MREKDGNARKLRYGRRTDDDDLHGLGNLGKLPPQDIPMEEFVLGGLMLMRDAVDVLPYLKPEHFYLEKHKYIYIAITTLFQTSSPIDTRSVVNELRNTGNLEIAGGLSYMVELTSKVHKNVTPYHAHVIKGMAQKRLAITIASDLMTKGYDDEVSPEELVELISKGQMELLEDMKTSREEHISVRVVELGIEFSNRTEPKKDADGIPTGYPSLDRIIRGWRPKLFIIIACRPGMGKSTLAMNFVVNAAVLFHVPVDFYSLEMDKLEVADKMISLSTEIPTRRLTHEVPQHGEVDRYMEKTRELAKAGIWIDDTPGLTTLEMRANLRRRKRLYGIKLVFIDYLQLMKGSGKYGGNREAEVSAISRDLKLIAMELDMPVIALSQLSREVEKRGGDKKPQLSDLRESGSLEQDADIVIMPWRPEYYNMEGDTDANGVKRTFKAGVTELGVKKHRGGRTGECAVIMNPETSKFHDTDGPFINDYPVADQPKWTDIQNQRLIDYSEPAPKEADPDPNDLPF